jgi:nucleoside-diphosphate-sugar epimerase
MSKPRDVYLVIGGSGFLGRHIVQQLLGRGDNVSAFDIVQRYHDVPFFSGDITNEEQLVSALRTVRDSYMHVLHKFTFFVVEWDHLHYTHCISSCRS